MKRILSWLHSFSPWYLRHQNRALQVFIDRQDLEIARLSSPDEPTARAMLMQLRVHQESVKHRMGYMVSAFIAEGVIEKLKALPEPRQKQFISVVAETLVSNAIRGIFKRSQATNKLTALIFSPITKRGQNSELVGGIFETNESPRFVPVSSNAPKQVADI